LPEWVCYRWACCSWSKKDLGEITFVVVLVMQQAAIYETFLDNPTHDRFT
jgi:hypothetical protein